jgi:hypothetical protein
MVGSHLFEGGDWGGGWCGQGERECEEELMEQGDEEIVPERQMDGPTSYLVIIICQQICP